MKLLLEHEIHQVQGGYWGHAAVAIADAAYDFYQGFTDNRR